MLEDERGITPPAVTAMTLEPRQGGYLLTVERGNGDVVHALELSSMERAQLGHLLVGGMSAPVSISFVDVTRANGNGKAHG